jgi:Rad3-related DNA helicase
MTTNNIESIEIVEISLQTRENARENGHTDEVKQETTALLEAIKKRAQAEAESAGTLTRETYLNAVRQAREVIERDKLIERERLEYSWARIQEELERNWYLMSKDIADFSDRFQNAAKAAWEAFNAPRPQDK